MAFVVAIADSCAWDVLHDLVTFYCFCWSKYGTFSYTFVSHLCRARTKYYAIPYHVIWVCGGAVLDWDGRCCSEFRRRLGRPLNIAVKFESGEDWICSRVDVSFEAIVEGLFLFSSHIFL